MPPKRGRPSKADLASLAKEAAVAGEGIENYTLPKALVTRLAKAAIPDTVRIAKEVPPALVKSSTVFINYLAAMAQEKAAEKKQKTIAAQHVLDAVKMLGWEDGAELSALLKKELKTFRKLRDEAKSKPSVPAAPGTGKRGRPAKIPPTFFVRAQSEGGAGPSDAAALAETEEGQEKEGDEEEEEGEGDEEVAYDEAEDQEEDEEDEEEEEEEEEIDAPVLVKKGKDVKMAVAAADEERDELDEA